MSHRRASLRLLQRRMTSPIAISALLQLLIAPMICCCCTSAISGYQDVYRPRLQHTTTSSSSSRGKQASTSAGILLWAFQTPINSASSFGQTCDTTTKCIPRSTSIIPKSPAHQGAPGGTRNVVDTPASGREAGSPCVIGHGEGGASTSSRRRFLSGFGAAATAVVAASTMQPRASFAAARSIEDIKKAVEADFVTGRYYVTGELTPSLYRPDCLFTDPTTRVAGVEKYTKAVKLLFDPDNSQIDLLSFEVQDSAHLYATWRLQGYLKFPWHPYVAPYTGTTLYTVDSEGLISSHEETWSISVLEAARATVTPTAGPPSRSP